MESPKEQTFQDVANEIAKADAKASHRKAIRLPKWIKIVRHIRYTQCPREYRAVFDIECHPEYRKFEIPQKVGLANAMANMHLGTEGVEYVTPEIFEDGNAYIKNHRVLHEALVVMYRNLKIYNEQMDDFDEVLRKARIHNDPTKMMTLWKTVASLNEAFEAEHTKKINKDTTPPHPVITLPDYMKLPNPQKTIEKEKDKCENTKSP